MTVTRKNIPRPVIPTDQQNGIDYVFLIIILMFVFIFLGTVMCKTRADNESTGKAPGAITSVHRLV